MEKTILLVEDEQALLKILGTYFKKEGYRVFEAADGLKALEIFQSHNIDIACVDIMIPNINGLELVKTIKASSKIPIILITALTSEENQLKGYELEIDEYVPKPFSPLILVKKVQSVLRRYEKQIDSNKHPNYKIGGLEINFDSRVVLVEGVQIELSKTEFDMLSYMIKHQNTVIDRNTFLDEVWGMDVFVEDRVVDTFIKTLRRKLTNGKNYIKTVHGIGYKFEVGK